MFLAKGARWNHSSQDVISFMFSSEFKDGWERHISIIRGHSIEAQGCTARQEDEQGVQAARKAEVKPGVEFRDLVSGRLSTTWSESLHHSVPYFSHL